MALRVRVVEQAMAGGASLVKLSQLFGPSVTTIVNWVSAYEKGGVDALVPQARGAPPRRPTVADKAKQQAVIALREEQPYVAFAQAVTRAVAESESRDLATILKAATTQWQAAAWRLERRFPEKYGRHDRVKVEAKIEHDGASLLAKLGRLIDGDAEPKKRGRPPKEPTE